MLLNVHASVKLCSRFYFPMSSGDVLLFEFRIFNNLIWRCVIMMCMILIFRVSLLIWKK